MHQEQLNGKLARLLVELQAAHRDLDDEHKMRLREEIAATRELLEALSHAGIRQSFPEPSFPAF
jgi:hypothetical protein